jgi:diguanylate cyclase (GGDEF)-like protein/PAS domain S-box-containing protein
MTAPAADPTSRVPHDWPRDGSLRAAQELTGLGWWELDLGTGSHVWSDAMYRLVGLEPRGPGGAPPGFEEFLQLMHPEDRAGAQALREAGFTTGPRQPYRVVHPDGSLHYLQAWTEVCAECDGRPSRVRGATIDVTERETALQTEAESRARLAAALDLNSTAVWEWDVRTGLLSWSPRMMELMAYDPDGPPPALESFLARVHPEDRQRIRELGDRTAATGQPEQVTYRVVHPDGAVLHIRAWTDVRTGPSGAVTHLWGTAMDISPQQEYAARLRANEEHFRVAFDLAPIGMTMVSLSPAAPGQYLRSNAAFQKMVGRTEAELLGLTIGDLTHPDDRDRDVTQFGELISGQLPSLALEKRYIRPNGQTVDAWITSSVVHGAEGQPLYLITHAVDMSDRLREQAELKRLALTDTLTGLANRTLLSDRLGHALAGLERRPGCLAMLLLDVDRFKTVNDSLGHQVGDALLVEIAKRLVEVTRNDSTVARLGGDEFVVLVEGVDTVEAVEAVAGRLLRELRRPFEMEDGQPPISASVSIGISLANGPGRRPGDLYREADLALYRAKDAGRDHYALFDEELRASADRRLTSETLLRKALAEDALVAYFQPIIDLDDGCVHGAEALARLMDGDRLVAPAEFIDVAEETGLIVEVDSRMFEHVAAQFTQLARRGTPVRRLTTNVSARTLEDPAFLPRIRAAMARHDVPGSGIRIELTERTLLAATPAVRDALTQIAEMGIHVGLDDFGTGYSALAYLQSFPLQFLKIDRSFVSRLGASARDDAVVAAVIDLSHAHDLVVVGEGVETPEQLEALRRAGCDRAQGYLMGKPMTVEDFSDLLLRDPRW